MSVMSWKECLLDPQSCVTSAGKETANRWFWDTIGNWLAKGLSDLAIKVFDKVTVSTTPDFSQAWWRDNFDLIVKVTLPLLVIAFVVQCASAAIRREPVRLGQAVTGALLGTAGVPFAIAVVVACGDMVDRVSSGILGGNGSVTRGFRRIIDIIAVVATMPSQGGILVTAIEFAILAMLALYFVLIVREVALVAFVIFAPIAMASWTWSATRHWLRRWVELIAALLFSKMVMAVIFAVGLSAMGNSDEYGGASLGTFLAGSLLFAMAAFAPMATYTFIHWAGDQGQAALYAVQQGTAGTSAIKARAEQAYRWAASDFIGSRSGGSVPTATGESDDETAPDAATSYNTSSHGQASIGPESVVKAPVDTAHATEAAVDRSAGQNQPRDNAQAEQGGGAR